MIAKNGIWVRIKKEGFRRGGACPSRFLSGKFEIQNEELRIQNEEFIMFCFFTLTQAVRILPFRRHTTKSLPLEGKVAGAA